MSTDSRGSGDRPAVYTWDPNSNSGKPLLVFNEKGVEFDYHYISLTDFEQHAPEYVAINPDGTVPALVHRGRVFTESTPMCEYIDASFAGPSLVPNDAGARYRMRHRCRRTDKAAEALSVICLEELALPYKFHALDLKKLDQWSPAHRSMVPQGEVPVLVDGVCVMSDATIALLYLGESHRQANLVPSDPVERYDVQALNEVLDAALLGSVNLIGWHRQQDGAARAAFNEALAALSGRQKAAGWSAVWHDAESDRCRRAEEKIAGGVAKIEAALGMRSWLVGDGFTIADIGAFALAESLPALMPGLVDAERTPQLYAWILRMRARPAVRRALTGAGRSHGATLYAPPQ